MGESEVTSLVWQTLAQAGQPVSPTRSVNPSGPNVRITELDLSGVGDDAQLANIDLQNVLQKQQQMVQLLPNVPKLLYDTAMAVVRKIGG